MTSDPEHRHASAGSFPERIAIEDAFARREKQWPVLWVFVVLALATSLYHLIIGF